MKGLSKGRYDETFAGEDDVLLSSPISSANKLAFSSIDSFAYVRN